MGIYRNYCDRLSVLHPKDILFNAEWFNREQRWAFNMVIPAGLRRAGWLLGLGVVVGAIASPSLLQAASVPSSPFPVANPVNAPFPQPNAEGDYKMRTSHRTWVVVDPDKAGLNCRWSPKMPTAWYAPDAKFPNFQYDQWPVVRKLPPGSALVSNITPAGFATLFDAQNKPWLKVSIGPKDQICLVRANQRFVRPTKTAPNR